MTKSWLLPAVQEPGTPAPQYFRQTFPYVLPPLTRFEPDAQPLDPAPEIWITDTTFRDGQQSRAPYTAGQIADLYELLARLGGRRGMIRQSEFFLYTDKDRRAVELCQEKGLRYPEITGWIRATLDVKIRYPDTLGIGVPHPNAALPRGIPRLTGALRRDAGVPPEALEFHGQNDLTAIIPNAVCAWLYGAAANNGTLLGIGERSGNTPIESLVFWLISLTGETLGMDTRAITEIADYYRGIGEPIDVRLPLVGDNFNVTRAGVHADGLIKDEEIYNPFDTTRLLGRPPRVAITDKSGAAGLLMWIRDHRSELAAGLTKQDPRLRQLNEAIMGEFSAGRITSLGDREVGRLVDQAFQEAALS